MNVTLADLGTITEDVLTTVVGLSPIAGEPVAVDVDAAGWLAGRIGIHGTYDAELAVQCSRALAGRIAAAFFGCPPSAAQAEDATDALLELANILAGHVNALMTAPSRITLPSAVVGSGQAAPLARGTPPDLAVAYACDGEGVVVTLRRLPGATEEA